MSISAVTSVTSGAAAQAAADAFTPAKPSASEVKKAAGQFEAIILRQLLSPSIEPMMNGGLGGSGSGGAGGGIYGYMLTDVLCNSLGSAGGLGLGRMLERQFAGGRSAATHPSDSATTQTPSP